MSLLPAQSAFALTPSDSTDVPNGSCRALYVGVGGNLSIVTGGATVTFAGVLGGTVLPVSCSRVRSTGTTASSIVALY